MFRHRKWFLFLAVLTLATALVYGASARFGLLSYDDRDHLTDNPYLAHPSAESLTRFWKAPYFGLYIPVTYTYWTGLAAIAPPAQSAAPYHLGNLALHTLCAAFVLVLLRRLGCDDRGALLGALFFLLHPLHAEPVAWASGAKDLLSSAFFLGACVLYPSHLVWAAGAGVLAILAKPSAVILAPVLLILDRFAEKTPWRTALKRAAFLFAAMIPAVIATIASQPQGGMNEVPPLWLRPFVAGEAVGAYFGFVVLPFALAPDYGMRPSVRLATALPFTWTVVLGIALYFAWKHRHRVPQLLPAIALFVISLAPTLGLVPFRFQEFSTVADRYAYLALLGPALLVGRLRSIPAQLVLGAFLVVFAWSTKQHVARWRTDTELFTNTLAVNPRSLAARDVLGVQALRNGDTETARRLFAEALALEPRRARSHMNLGIAMLQSGDASGATPHLEQAVALEPGYPLAYTNLCSAYQKLGRLDEALASCEKARALNPEHAQTYINIGAIRGIKGDFAGAESALIQATARDPRSADAYANLGVALESQGKIAAAIVAYQRAADLAPQLPAAFKDHLSELNAKSPRP